MSDDVLIRFLRRNNLILVNEEKTVKKMNNVLEHLQFLVDEWISNYLKDKERSDCASKQKHGKIISSGSHALGLVDEDSDLDLICVASNSIERKKFHESFGAFAETQPGVELVQSLEFNHCPLIKIVLDGVKVDLTLAILKVPSLSEDLKLNSEFEEGGLMDGMDERCVQSLNGHRNMVVILEMVPDVTLFRNILAAVKLWAKRRLIYSHSIGHLGGVAWTVMVAHVCVNHAGLTQLLTLKKFFEIFFQWHWPKPVLLKELSNRKTCYNSWNPKNDYKQVMPIILPCHPEHNCAFNVNLLSRNAIVEELRRGHYILEESFEFDSTLAELFRPFFFFKSYRIFLLIIFAGQTNMKEQMLWGGVIESRIRFLLRDLAKKSVVKSARILPKQFVFANNLGNFLTKWYVGLELFVSGGKEARLDLANEIEKFKTLVYDRTAEYGWKREKADLKVFNIVDKRENEEEMKGFLPGEYKGYYLFDGQL